MCDANSGFINLGDGILIDTQSDVKHAQMMIDLLSTISEGHPKFIINIHEDCDHVLVINYLETLKLLLINRYLKE